MERVILGSRSKGRRQCLTAAGIAHSLLPADIDEKAVTVAGGARAATDPQQLTVAIARAKAAALMPQLAGSDHILITSGAPPASITSPTPPPPPPPPLSPFLLSLVLQTESSRFASSGLVRMHQCATQLIDFPHPCDPLRPTTTVSFLSSLNEGKKKVKLSDSSSVELLLDSVV